MRRKWDEVGVVGLLVLVTTLLAKDSSDLLSAPLPLGALLALIAALVVWVRTPSAPRFVGMRYGIAALASVAMITSARAWMMWIRLWQPEGYPSFSAEANARVERSFDVAAISLCATLGCALIAALISANAARKLPAS